MTLTLMYNSLCMHGKYSYQILISHWDVGCVSEKKALHLLLYGSLSQQELYTLWVLNCLNITDPQKTDQYIP